jgi:hypothetical protein
MRSARSCGNRGGRGRQGADHLRVSEFTTANAVAFARDAERIGVDGSWCCPRWFMCRRPPSWSNTSAPVAQATGLPHHAVQQSAGLPGQHRLRHARRLAQFPTLWRSRSRRPIRAASPTSITPSASASCTVRRARRCCLRRSVPGCARLGFGSHERLSARIAVVLRSAARRGPGAGPADLPLVHAHVAPGRRARPGAVDQTRGILMGRGSERVRPPRLPLAGQRREQVTEMVAAAAARPV